MKQTALITAILKIASRQKFYGYDIERHLAAKGIKIEIGNLYRLLNKMRRDGLLDAHWETSLAGPNKKVYSLSTKGKKEMEQTLLDAIEIIHESYGAYLSSLKDDQSIFFRLANYLVYKSNSSVNLTYFSPNITPMHEKVLQAFRTMNPNSRIYLITPNSIKLPSNIGNTICLNGDYESFPLRDKFTNVLFINGLPSSGNFERSIVEWARVLGENGKLGILIPTHSLNEHKDPLSLGDFIEKLEHQTIEKYSADSLNRLLSDAFDNIHTEQILHMSLFLCIKSKKDTLNSSKIDSSLKL